MTFNSSCNNKKYPFLCTTTRFDCKYGMAFLYVEKRSDSQKIRLKKNFHKIYKKRINGYRIYNMEEEEEEIYFTSN